VSTTVVAMPAASTAKIVGLRHIGSRRAAAATGITGATGVTAAASGTSAGFTHHSTTPPATPTIWVPSNAQLVSIQVARRTPSTGPSMNESSVISASSESTAFRSPSSTAEISVCRTTEKSGRFASPPTTARPSSAAYETKGAIDQTIASTTSCGPMVARRPIRSSARPRHGPATAIAIVLAVESRPAAV
jgi:hypothetical protein